MAQSATSAATAAADAFGERIGIEQIGLYNEMQVRGFNLMESGNFRFDGAYFIRSAMLADNATQGVTIRVGVNALGIDFPAPSGIVDYRAVVPTAKPHLSIETGIRDYTSPDFLFNGSLGSNPGLGLAYGGEITHRNESDGSVHDIMKGALVPLWKPNDRFSIKGLLAVDSFRGDAMYSFMPNAVALAQGVLPPEQKQPGHYPVNWAQQKMLQINYGAVARLVLTNKVSLQSSLLVSQADRTRNDFTSFSVGPDGKGTGSALRGRPGDTISLAGETKLNYQILPRHRLFATARLRKTDTNSRPGISYALGAIDQSMDTPYMAPPPEPSIVDPTTDHVDQIAGGLGYEGFFGKGLRVRAAVMKTRFEKTVTPPGGPAQINLATPWLYDAAVSYAFSDAFTVFTTVTKGLEESGTAPNSATNRNEVLPAVLADQLELGLRWRLGGNLTFIGSLFEVAKLTPGVDSAGAYRLVSKARHRGLELSLTGRVLPELNIVTGAVFMDPQRRGALVDSGVISSQGTGAAKITGLVNLTYEPRFAKGLAFDTQFNYFGSRIANTRTRLKSDGYYTVDVGFRYGFEMGGLPSVFRFRVGNIFDDSTVFAMRTETLVRPMRRGVRAGLTVNFD